MKAEYEKCCFNWMISRISVLVVFVSILMGPSWSALASTQNDETISCGEFIAMLANHQPGNPLFPSGYSQLSKEELYLQTVQNMSAKGFRVLDGKSFHDPLEANEFVQVSYAFAEGSPGGNLFEQKLFLKKAGIIDSADVGLTTAYDGKVYQTHQEETVIQLVRLATPIYMHDNIRTDLSAKATFTFDDGSTLTMAEGSTLNITKHIYDPDQDLRQTIIHLSEGAVRFVVTKGKARGSVFKVITPTATAGVRGTEFIVIVNPSGKTTFLVTEGQIETRSTTEIIDWERDNWGVEELVDPDETYLVSAGESQNFFKNGKATKVMKTPPGLLKTAMVKTQNPSSNIWKQGGLSKKMARARDKAQKLGWAKKAKNNKDLKTKVIQLANNIALFHVKTLGNNIGKDRVGNSPNFTLNNAGKAKANAKANARAQANASAKAKANANARAQANASAKAKANAKAKAKANASAKGKAKGKP